VAASKGAIYMRRRRAEGKAWDQQPENRERVRQRQLKYWHRADGGWLKRRTRDLAAQRERVLRDLELLGQERKAIEAELAREVRG
jgi:hypothetical protein